MNKELMRNYADTFMDKVAVIHSACDETPKSVAFVAVDKKWSDKEKSEIAFMKTNSINDAWWNNEEVTKMFDGNACRSTSSGDHVLIGNKKYKCARIGWELV